MEDISLLGGLRAVTNVTARDAIPTPHRKAGMFVWTQNEAQLWRLNTGLTNGDWIEFTGGGLTINGDLASQEGALVVVGFYGRPLTEGGPNIGDAYIWDGSSFTLSPAGGGSGVPFGGDLSDNGGFAAVSGIQTIPVSGTLPNIGEALVYNGTDYTPAPIAALNGDLADDGGGNARVIAIQGNSVIDSGAPNEGDVLTFSSGQWTPVAPTGGAGLYYKTTMANTSANTTDSDTVVNLVSASFFDFTTSNSLIIDASANAYMDAPGYIFFRLQMGDTTIRSGRIYVPGTPDHGACISFHEHLPSLGSGGSISVDLEWAVETNGDTATCEFATIRMTEVFDYNPGP